MEQQQQQPKNLVSADKFKFLLEKFQFKNNKEENEELLRMFNKLLQKPLKQALAVTLLQCKEDGKLFLESAKKRVKVYRWTTE